MDRPRFAEHFVTAGFVTLVFDYRYFGASEGEPRCQLFPQARIEDYRNALTCVNLGNKLIDGHFKFYKQVNDDPEFAKNFLDWLFERYLGRSKKG